MNRHEYTEALPGAREARLDVTRLPAPMGWWITTLAVPLDDDGEKAADRLVQRVLRDADAAGARVSVSTDAASLGGMELDALVAWYWQHGFTGDPDEGPLTREPWTVSVDAA